MEPDVPAASRQPTLPELARTAVARAAAGPTAQHAGITAHAMTVQVVEFAGAVPSPVPLADYRAAAPIRCGARRPACYAISSTGT